MKGSVRALLTFLVTVLVGSTGCNSGVATATPVLTSNPNGNSAPDTSGKPGGNVGKTSGPGPTTESGTAGAVYFNTFKIEQGALGHAIGVGFLSTASDVTTAFELEFSCALNGTGRGCLFAPSSGGFTFVEPSLSGGVLSSLHVSSLQTSTLLRASGPLQALAADPDGKWAATSDGGPRIQLLFEGVSKVDLDITSGDSVGSKVLRLQGARGGKLLVTTDSSTLLFSISPKSEHLEQTFNGISSATISADGAQVAGLVSGQPAQLRVYRSAFVQTVPAPDGSISDLSFADASALVFRLDSATSGSEIVRVDVTTGSAEVVASLGSGPAGVAGVSCPVGVGEQIYYSDRQGNGWAIFRAARSPSGWTNSPFAIPTEDSVAFVCPESWQGGSP